MHLRPLRLLPHLALPRSRWRCAPHRPWRRTSRTSRRRSRRPTPRTPAPPRCRWTEIRRYVAVYNAVKEAYVEPVDDKKLMQSAIRGLLFDLDPHSVYLDTSDAEEFDEQSRGAYGGVGVELQRQPDGTLRVIAPIDDTPAARAGHQGRRRDHRDRRQAVQARRRRQLRPAARRARQQGRADHRARRQAQTVRRHPDRAKPSASPACAAACSNRATATCASPRSRPTPPPISSASSTSCASRPAASCADW